MELCYEDIGELSPDIISSFKGYSFTISTKNVWVRLEGLFCLAIVRDLESNQSTLGLDQQRNIRMGYDLAHNHLTFLSLSLLRSYIGDTRMAAA